MKEGVMLDLKELATFIKVAELKSFSKTADFLEVTQPTITNHIQSLERGLDTRLINRKGKNLTLTDSGEILYRYAIDILNSCQMAKFDLKSNEESIKGHLSVFGSSIARRHLLPELIDGFIREHPDMTFSISGLATQEAIQSIENRRLDFAFVARKDETFENITFVKVMEEELLTIVPNSFPYTNYSIVDKDIFLNNKTFFKTLEPVLYTQLTKEFKEAGLDLKDINMVGDATEVETIKELVSLGAGIGIIPKRDVEKDLALARYKTVILKDASFKREVYFAYPSDRHLTPINEIFKNFVLKYVEKNITDK